MKNYQKVNVPAGEAFVNLKSNTMKNTLQRYELFAYLQIKQIKKTVL